ncbi:MAG TPA: PGPGW domain-containing protein [Candidatus Polarisedimenticolaceae bacterium]|nr:PGPGW domain-containing protein [Candidatus Polarisedimenticolaceae bacterium]
MKPASRLRKVLDWTLGLGLIALGIVGLVLPGLQGILLILAGLAVLSSHSPRARRLLDMLKAKVKAAKDRVTRNKGTGTS